MYTLQKGRIRKTENETQHSNSNGNESYQHQRLSPTLLRLRSLTLLGRPWPWGDPAAPQPCCLVGQPLEERRASLGGVRECRAARHPSGWERRGSRGREENKTQKQQLSNNCFLQYVQSIPVQWPWGRGCPAHAQRRRHCGPGPGGYSGAEVALAGGSRQRTRKPLSSGAGSGSSSLVPLGRA